jgi:hypothetical protein
VASAFAGAAQLVTYVTVLMCMELSPHWGWRAAFRFPMLPMLLMLVFFAFLFKTGPEKIGLPPFCEEDEESAARDTALEAEIKQDEYLLQQKKVFLLDLIATLDDIDMQSIMIKRYIEKKTWNTIVDETFFSRSWVYRLHQRALDQLDSTLSGYADAP